MAMAMAGFAAPAARPSEVRNWMISNWLTSSLQGCRGRSSQSREECFHGQTGQIWWWQKSCSHQRNQKRCGRNEPGSSEEVRRISSTSTEIRCTERWSRSVEEITGSTWSCRRTWVVTSWRWYQLPVDDGISYHLMMVSVTSWRWCMIKFVMNWNWCEEGNLY